MARTTKSPQRERTHCNRGAIINRINELTIWLLQNEVSSKEWDNGVRELNAMELRLEMMDTPKHKSTHVEYGVSLPTGLALQY